jgi:hypothetical protein
MIEAAPLVAALRLITGSKWGIDPWLKSEPAQRSRLFFGMRPNEGPELLKILAHAPPRQSACTAQRQALYHQQGAKAL